MSGVTAPLAIAEAIRQGFLGSPTSVCLDSDAPQPLGLFFDLNVFEDGVRDVQQAFGPGFLHAIAVKANPLSSILKIVKAKGLGAECASIGEILHCLDIGFDVSKIVYDSPVKTAQEIRFALEKGIHINADNFQELDVISEELKNINWKTKSVVGLRVNPLVGLGDIKALSCASVDSKFGVPMTDEIVKQIIAFFADNSWMTCLHVHIGSQSFDAESLAKGLRKAVLLALEINKNVGQNQVSIFDIGGGVPVNRDDDTVKPTFYEYAETLKKVIPELFPEYGIFKKVVTEFGQALNSKAGFLVSRVEYVKRAPVEEDLRIVLTHVGADLCTRTCYCPQVKKYQRRVCVFDKNGKLKEGNEKLHNIAGPLCFSGDIVKHRVVLPEIERGDYVALLDCGGNSIALSNRHCSRFSPRVYGYRAMEKCEVNFFLLKEAETKEELIKFWGGGKHSSYNLKDEKEN